MAHSIRLATVHRLFPALVTAAFVAVATGGPTPVGAVSFSLVISQVYGGGGNSGATLTHDFIELYNRGAEPVSVNGWSVQYLPASGNGTWQTTPLTGVIGPGEYYLVQEAQGSGGTAGLPLPDAIGTIAMSGTAAHVALVDSASPLPAGSCIGLAGVIDFVGFGSAVCREGVAAAPAATNTLAVTRLQSGCLDTDENSADFVAAAPRPRNRQVTFTCGPSTVQTLSINQIQGNGLLSPVSGERIATFGIVTGLKSNGFFLQTPDADVDIDPTSSEGIFVFTSSAPGRAIGEYVSVTGVVQEFIPAADLASPALTEIVAPTVALLTSGNPMPAPMAITASDTLPGGGTGQLEKYEGMRVSIDSLTVIAPTGGTTNEPNATGTSNGVFYAVITGVGRPFREPGIDILSPLPAGSPANVPRFDGNPERLRVDSDAQPGALPLNVSTGAIITAVVGPLDYGFRTYTVLPDAASPPTMTGGLTATPVSLPGNNEFTVGSVNLERFFDTVDDAGTSDAVLTPAAFANRLNKASLAIRGILRAPDILGVAEVENLTTLEALAAKIGADAVASGEPDPMYQAMLEEGNDIGGIDVGVLIRRDRVTVEDYAQLGKDAVYTDPNTGQAELLNDRPSLLLRANVHPAGMQPSTLTVIVNHLRSLSGVDDPADGGRIRAKRRAQAEYLAGQVQAIQQSGPDEGLVLVGDFNAFVESDGYVDVLGTIIGRPAPADQVVLASPDLVEPDLLNLVTTVPAEQQYSYVFDGNAQALDHVIVSQVPAAGFVRLEYGRSSADFPASRRSDPNRPERLTDHDMVVAYFRTVPVDAADRTAPVLALPADITVAADRPSGAAVSFDVRAVDAVDGPVAFTCNPGSGARFPIAATIVECRSTDSSGNTATGAFTVTVIPPETSGRMIGNGWIRASGARHEIAFAVAAPDGRDGYLRFSVRRSRRGEPDADRFQSTAVTSVWLFDAPGSDPGRGRHGTAADRVVFAGAGTWNGRGGYTFEARAIDRGEPGRGRDRFALTIRDRGGRIVSKLDGTLDEGNIQARR